MPTDKFFVFATRPKAKMGKREFVRISKNKIFIFPLCVCCARAWALPCSRGSAAIAYINSPKTSGILIIWHDERETKVFFSFLSFGFHFWIFQIVFFFLRSVLLLFVSYLFGANKSPLNFANAKLVCYLPLHINLNLITTEKIKIKRR